jgi:hypothetical protein
MRSYNTRIDIESRWVQCCRVPCWWKSSLLMFRPTRSSCIFMFLVSDILIEKDINRRINIREWIRSEWSWLLGSSTEKKGRKDKIGKRVKANRNMHAYIQLYILCHYIMIAKAYCNMPTERMNEWKRDRYSSTHLEGSIDKHYCKIRWDSFWTLLWID